MKTIDDSRVLFYRLWALEYSYRNNDFKHLVNEIKQIEDHLKDDIEIINIEIENLPKNGIEERKDQAVLDWWNNYITKYPWKSEEPSFFSERHYDKKESAHYNGMPLNKKEMMDKAIYLANYTMSKFGFAFDSRPARDSLYILQHIDEYNNIIFPEHARGINCGHWLRGHPISEIDDLSGRLQYVNNKGVTTDIEEHPGEVILSFNFLEPLPLLIKTLTDMYEWWNGTPGKSNYYFSSRRNDCETLRCISLPEASLPESQRPRAIGLWLWDRVQELGGGRGTVKQAVHELENEGHLQRLGLQNVEDSDLKFWRKRTNECIQAAEVLSFTKRKKGTKNAE